MLSQNENRGSAFFETLCMLPFVNREHGQITQVDFVVDCEITEYGRHKTTACICHNNMYSTDIHHGP